MEKIAINRDISAIIEQMAQDEDLPLWIELLPAGDPVVGRDGRSFNNPDPQAIINAFNKDTLDLPIDTEHTTQLKAPQGDYSPACGWVKALEVRNGAIWGLVEWTDTWDIKQKRYRYISPVFTYNNQTKQIDKLISVGLTNRPNLNLQALNQQQGDHPMTIPVTILTALALHAQSNEGDVLNAINALKSTAPAPGEVVPKADLEAALNRASTAEAELNKIRDAANLQEINQALDSAIEGGIIAPASRDYHLNACQKEGGLEAFKALCASSPPVLPGAPLVPAKSPDTVTNASLPTHHNGVPVDQDRAVLHQAALNHQAKTGCTYIEAAKAVGA